MTSANLTTLLQQHKFYSTRDVVLGTRTRVHFSSTRTRTRTRDLGTRTHSSTFFKTRTRDLGTRTHTCTLRTRDI
jgi:hypothetical protein